MSARAVFDRRPPEPPRLSLIVPVYNEKASILPVLERLRGLDFSHEVIVVDDGSTDGTRALLEAAPGPFLLLFHERNTGKGAAVRTGLAAARGAFVGIQDADLEYDPREYAALLAEMSAYGADAVYGSRFLRSNPNIYKRFLLGNKLLTGFVNLLCRSRFTDSYTCYKLLKRESMIGLGLTSKGFELEAEISVKIARRGLSYREVPIHYSPRRIEEGKKINAGDALKGLWTVWKLWLTERRGSGGV